MVGVVGKTGFEPATPWSQTRCATGLRYFPNGVAKLGLSCRAANKMIGFPGANPSRTGIRSRKGPDSRLFPHRDP